MTTQGRPLTDAASWTCDWGGCDDESTAERFDPNTGEWLGVCSRHEAPADLRTTYPRGRCAECGKETTVSREGKVRAHDRPGLFAARCPGSYRTPRS